MKFLKKWRRSIAFGLISLLLWFLVWAPWIPTISELNRETARVSSIDKGGLIDVTKFVASSGDVVTCAYTRNGGCEPQAMQNLLAAGTDALVWHDRRRIYQIAVDGKVLFPYSRVRDGMGLWTVLAGLSVFAFLLQLGLDIGIVQTARQQYPELRPKENEPRIK